MTFRYTLFAVLVMANLAAAEDWVSVGASPRAASADSPPTAVVHSSPQGKSSAAEDGQLQLITELIARVEQLQAQVSQMSGQIESQRYKLEKLEKASESRYLDMDRRLASLTVAQAESPVTVPTHENSVQSVSDQDAYQTAMKLLRAKEYDQASSAYDSFIRNYPDSDLLQNAFYWSGAVYLFQQDYDAALERFKAVIDRFPEGGKAADATYSYAVTLHKSGDLEGARHWLNQVLTEHAGAQGNAVSLATDYLKKLDAVAE